MLEDTTNMRLKEAARKREVPDMFAFPACMTVGTMLDFELRNLGIVLYHVV